MGVDGLVEELNDEVDGLINGSTVGVVEVTVHLIGVSHEWQTTVEAQHVEVSRGDEALSLSLIACFGAFVQSGYLIDMLNEHPRPAYERPVLFFSETIDRITLGGLQESVVDIVVESAHGTGGNMPAVRHAFYLSAEIAVGVTVTSFVGKSVVL